MATTIRTTGSFRDVHTILIDIDVHHVNPTRHIHLTVDQIPHSANLLQR